MRARTPRPSGSRSPRSSCCIRLRVCACLCGGGGGVSVRRAARCAIGRGGRSTAVKGVLDVDPLLRVVPDKAAHRAVEPRNVAVDGAAAGLVQHAGHDQQRAGRQHDGDEGEADEREVGDEPPVGALVRALALGDARAVQAERREEEHADANGQREVHRPERDGVARVALEREPGDRDHADGNDRGQRVDAVQQVARPRPRRPVGLGQVDLGVDGHLSSRSLGCWLAFCWLAVVRDAGGVTGVCRVLREQ